MFLTLFTVALLIVVCAVISSTGSLGMSAALRVATLFALGAKYVCRWVWGRVAVSLSLGTERLRVVSCARLLCEDMGPVFVKFGQIVGSSAGLFPEAVVLEFGKCLDRVKPISFESVEQTIREELGELGNELAFVDPEPLASASIAQVHAAELTDGTKVVVKVQRPGIKGLVDVDVQILAWLAKGILKVVPNAAIANPRAIVEDFAKTLEEELDFRLEAENLSRFNECARDLGYSDIRAPVPHLGLSTRRVLVMERFFGVRVDDVESIRKRGVDAEAGLIRGLRAWLQMVMFHGFFHGDVHAGNLWLLDDGDIGFLDFGIVGRFDQSQREQITRYLVSLGSGNFEELTDVMAEMAGDPRRIDRDVLARELQEAYEPLRQAALADIDPAEVVPRLNRVAVKHGLVLPREFVLITKQILYFDRYARLLAPELNLFTDPRLVSGLVADIQKMRATPRGPTIH